MKLIPKIIHCHQYQSLKTLIIIFQTYYKHKNSWAYNILHTGAYALGYQNRNFVGASLHTQVDYELKVETQSSWRITHQLGCVTNIADTATYRYNIFLQIRGINCPNHLNMPTSTMLNLQILQYVYISHRFTGYLSVYISVFKIYIKRRYFTAFSINTYPIRQHKIMWKLYLDVIAFCSPCCVAWSNSKTECYTRLQASKPNHHVIFWTNSSPDYLNILTWEMFHDHPDCTSYESAPQ